MASLRTLIDSGVTVAIGSDNVRDSSVLEAEHLHSLGVIDELALLKLWAEDTPRSIFPQRRIGFLRAGYEASFLALEGNPLDDWRNVRRIKLRFKQGVEVHPLPR
jgi:imidazolonepropionase-like amidohydrolase